MTSKTNNDNKVLTFANKCVIMNKEPRQNMNHLSQEPDYGNKHNLDLNNTTADYIQRGYHFKIRHRV
jgi:hypothetical protein